jgi:hypothetical protein
MSDEDWEYPASEGSVEAQEQERPPEAMPPAPEPAPAPEPEAPRQPDEWRRAI